MCQKENEDSGKCEMVEFDRYCVHAGYSGSRVLGRVDHMVFLLGHLRSKVLRVVGVDGVGHYRYTLVLDVKSYGVSLYTMCSHIVFAHLCIFLQLFRTSSLALWDSRVLSGRQLPCTGHEGGEMDPPVYLLHSVRLPQSHCKTKTFWRA